MSWSRELDNSKGVPKPNPRLLDKRAPSYQIFINHVLPKKLPKKAKQFWQVVKCLKIIVDKKCNYTFETDYFIDIVNIGGRKKIGDNLAWILRKEVCLALEICTHTVGFDDGISNYAQQTNVLATEKLAKHILKNMKGPKATFQTFYFYKDKTCKCNDFFLRFFPIPGEGLHIEGIGTFPKPKKKPKATQKDKNREEQ